MRTYETIRVFCNLNSKTFFRFVREDAALLAGYRPVSVHVNYHPEKPQRMVDLHAYYHGNDMSKGDKAGIWKWNGGEGSRLQAECKAAMKSGPPPTSKPHIQQVLLAKKAEWGGIKWVEFGSDGSLSTPWGKVRSSPLSLAPPLITSRPTPPLIAGRGSAHVPRLV